MKTCSVCNQSKSLNEYPKMGSLMCKPCKNKRDYKRRDKKKIKENSDRYRLKKGHSPRELREDGLIKGTFEYSREYNLKDKYGINIEEYNSLLKSQDNRCKICNIHIDDYKKSNFSVDHCHKTLKVRGLLCNKCNVGLGMFNDDLDILVSAVEYLR